MPPAKKTAAKKLLPAASKKGVMPPSGDKEISYTTSGLYASTQAPFRNPDELVGKKGLEIYRKMMFDDQVKAAVHAKQHAILSTGYEIMAPEVADEETEREVADELRDFVKFNFDDMEGSFNSNLYQIMSSMQFGFSATEKVYRLIDYGRWDGKIALKSLKTREPYGFEFYTDAHGNLLENGVRQDSRPMPAEKFVVHSYHKTFGNWYGESDLRSAYEPWWRKSNANRFKMITLERYGEPLLVFTHTQRLNDSNRTELQTFGQKLQNRSVLILPQFITLDLKQGDPKIASAFIPVIQEENVAIRIALLMPGLIGLSGEQAVGSFARAVKEFDAFIWVIEQFRNDLETLINEQIVKPTVDLNYDIEDGKYPFFRFKEITAQHRENLFKLWLQAVVSGAFTKTREDENKGRELIEFPKLPDDVPMTGEQQVQIDPLTGLPVDQGGSGQLPDLMSSNNDSPNFFPFGKDSILSYKRAV